MKRDPVSHSNHHTQGGTPRAANARDVVVNVVVLVLVLVAEVLVAEELVVL